ncbi:MAG: restriction endonuclease [Proteobacteria bacterium]|nr:restriction endonuclease [Pseudomonadota bacterium]
MARRRKTSPLEDFLELVAMMPWWAGVALALLAYVLLHRFAQPVQLAGVKPADMATAAVRSAGATLAGFAQYIVPVLCLLGAGMSAWRRHTRRTLLTAVAHARGADALDGISWREFEVLVAEAFRLQGFQVTETGGGGADGGVDLVLAKGGEKFLVQCKQWKAHKVGVEIVRELYGVMAARGATGGFVVTSGGFSSAAQEFARGRNLKLVDGARLFSLIQQAKTSLASTSTTPAELVEARQRGWTAAPGPICPSCGADMVKRTAKKGHNAGQAFWGCSTYPACPSVRSIA